MTDLCVTVDDYTLEATWADDAPETRAALENAVPVVGDAVRWGDELYFDVPLDVPSESASEVVPSESASEVVPEGAIAYWPAGGKLCLFWGPTPASRDGEPRAAAPVTVVARVDDVTPLSGLDGGAQVRLEQTE